MINNNKLCDKIREWAPRQKRQELENPPVCQDRPWTAASSAAGPSSRDRSSHWGPRTVGWTTWWAVGHWFQRGMLRFPGPSHGQRHRSPRLWRRLGRRRRSPPSRWPRESESFLSLISAHETEIFGVFSPCCQAHFFRSHCASLPLPTPLSGIFSV